ncbi:ABC transporter permease [Hydrogenimonas urashimensis]|uniref:ABC transporter permease n=1 Tax=Hydrogenimonas urashimensis TaxID=2740515 RepID=UPI00191655F3|nr:ABC transporter permease [Hydrogenimonas urashimensis]
MRLFLTLVMKEIIAFFRSWGLVAVVLYSFTLDIYIAGKGIEMQAKNVSVGYVDDTGGGISMKILSRLHAPEFQKPVRFLSQKALYDAIRNREIMVGLLFDHDFETSYEKTGRTQLNLLLDAISATQSFQALQYLQNIVLDFSNLRVPIELKIHRLFNPNARTDWFMAVAEMLSVTTLLGVILTAAVFVREKENGTWDIMLLMPIDPKLIILAKSFSQVIILMFGVVIATGIVLFGAFDVPVNQSLWAFFLLSFFYAFTSAGIGLFVAAVSRSMLQVAQLAILIMMPLIFLSGAWTPIHAMHPLLQDLSLLSPLRYYIEGSESIFFRGTEFVDLWPYFAGVIILGAILYLYGFRKIGKLF